MNGTLSRTLRVSDVMDKCKWWLTDVTFHWRRDMVTAIERNNQTRRIKIFFAAYLQELNQYFTNYEPKRCKNKV